MRQKCKGILLFLFNYLSIYDNININFRGARIMILDLNKKKHLPIIKKFQIDLKIKIKMWKKGRKING